MQSRSRKLVALEQRSSHPPHRVWLTATHCLSLAEGDLLLLSGEMWKTVSWRNHTNDVKGATETRLEEVGCELGHLSATTLPLPAAATKEHTSLPCVCKWEAIYSASGMRTSREADPPRKLAMSSWVALSGMISLLSLAPMEWQRFDLIVYCSLQKALWEVLGGCSKFCFNLEISKG